MITNSVIKTNVFYMREEFKREEDLSSQAIDEDNLYEQEDSDSTSRYHD